MSPIRSGSLFSGSGALDLAVAQVLGARPAWFVENDPAASRVLAHHWPDVPNHGDVTTVDWVAVEPIDVLTAGFPCQDISSAGKRIGLRPGTRSGLWSHVVYAISQLRPRLVVIENVRGLLSADAHCDLEPCPWCLGDRRIRPVRALGVLLGDLACGGYDAQWCGLPASGVGAPHGRFRVFIVARPIADSAGPGGRWVEPVHVGGHGGETLRAGQAEPGRRDRVVADPDSIGSVRSGGTRGWREGSTDHGEPPADPSGSGRWPGSGMGRSVGTTVVRDGAPSPADTTGDGWDEGWPEPVGQLRGSDAALGSHGAITNADSSASNGWAGESRREPLGRDAASGTLDWGAYEPAVRRWEHVLGRPAPAPTLTGKRGGQQLSPAFTEWMMGWPQGWVTDVPGLTRNDQVKICGNGVVPQQAVAALEWLLARE